MSLCVPRDQEGERRKENFEKAMVFSGSFLDLSKTIKCHSKFDREEIRIFLIA